MAADDATERWLRTLTVDEAARRRSERDDLRRLAAESATMRDIVAAIAADRHEVTVHVSGGTRTGPVVMLGPDHFEMLHEQAPLVVVWAAIGAVEPGPADGTDRRIDSSPTDLGERLRLRQGEGRSVTAGLRDRSVLTGRLLAVGQDVLTLDRHPLDGPVHVPLASLATLAL